MERGASELTACHRYSGLQTTSGSACAWKRPLGTCCREPAPVSAKGGHMTRSNRWIVVIFVILASASCFAQLAVSVRIGPPALPVYEQPLCPAAGYIWTPGYWAWGSDDYYWVPGTWVLAPEPGYLWTPGYWAFSVGLYRWHPGYWGSTVGFYGGIDYGYGYPGNGYYGGRWQGNIFYYNRAVNRVNVTNIHNVYYRRVANNVTVGRVSYNGGPGGTAARPTAAQRAAARGHHIAATSMQVRHEHRAKADRRQFASVNHGRPPVTTTARPAEFKARSSANHHAATHNPTSHTANRTASKTVSHPHMSRNNPEPARTASRTTNSVPLTERHSPPRPSERVHKEPAPPSNPTAHNGVSAPHSMPPARAEQETRKLPPRPSQPVRNETPHRASSPNVTARAASPPREAASPHEAARRAAAPPHEGTRPPEPKGTDKKSDR